MSKVCATARICVNVDRLARLLQGTIFMSVTPVAPEAMLMSWPVLLQRTRMEFMARAAAEGRVYVLGLYCQQRPC